MNSMKDNFICSTNAYNTFDKSVPLPLFRKVFYLSGKVKKAEILISSMGYYDLYFNGKNITRGLMVPYRSNPTHFLYCDKYDVADLVNGEKNCIAVMLGNGFQNSIVSTWRFDKLSWMSSPAVSFKIDVVYEDDTEETIISDSETKTHDSAITFCDFHIGEKKDARQEIDGWYDIDFDDSKWLKSLKAKCSGGEIKESDIQPITYHEEISVKAITPFENGYIYDFGENNSGVASLKVRGNEGQKITMHHFETFEQGRPCYDNISYNVNGVKSVFQVDEYICSGKGIETFVPKFTYHGFRYVFVEGISSSQATEDLLTYIVVHSDIEKVGDFECDNEMVNKLQKATQKSDISNFHHFPTDCPHREKQGWTGDAALSAEQMFLNFSPERNFRQWLENIYKAMKNNGQLPGVVPTDWYGYELGVGGPAWDAVIVYLPYYAYVYRGDKKIITDAAPYIYKYLIHLNDKKDEKGLIGFGLGDWCQPDSNNENFDAPIVVTDSIVSYDLAEKAVLIFKELGLNNELEFAKDFAKKLKYSIQKNLICDGIVLGDSQTGQSMALYYNLIPNEDKAKAFKRLLELIEKYDGHLHTGVIGAKSIFYVLSENGYVDLALNMMIRPDYPSFGNWIERGATTLWERFWGEGELQFSHNHHFWGDFSAWFYRQIAGIKIGSKFDDISYLQISPSFANELNFVKAKTKSAFGEVSVFWEKNGDKIKIKISKPSEMCCEVILPDGFVLNSGLNTLKIDKGISNSEIDCILQ